MSEVDEIADFSAEERASIRKLRETVQGVDKFSDGYILRFLRSKKGDVAETCEALKKNVVFRKAWDLDTALTDWKVPEVLKKYDPVGYFTDKENCPVFFTLFGNQDVEGLMKSTESQDYVKFSLLPTEVGLKRCEEQAKKSGKPYEQMLTIFDMENMNSSHYSYKPYTNSFLTVLTLIQDHYPLIFKKILVIRAPSMAQYGYNLLSPLLSQDTQDLVEFPGDGWKEAIFKFIDEDKWPEHWGGSMKDPDGDPKCPSKIPFGLGPVPESHYASTEIMGDDAINTTVYAGDKHLFEVDIKNTPASISWQYKTVAEDIGFAIYYDKSGEAQELTEMEVVYPSIRLECNLLPVSGSYRCEKTGKYVIEFDNYYSWFSAKELRYRIDVLEG